MASIGPKAGNTARKDDNGKLYFGDKDAAFLKQQSREAIETIHNAPILYFEIDWEQSKRNFYGEMLIKKFVDVKGVEVRGSFKIEQAAGTMFQGLPNQLMKLIVSVYVEQLEELKIDPQLGDYFGVGKRLYQLYTMTSVDAGPGNLMMNRERMRQDFFAMEDDVESLLPGVDLGLEYDIKPGNTQV